MIRNKSILSDVVETLHQIRVEVTTLAERPSDGTKVPQPALQIVVLITDFCSALNSA